ncbi:MAG: HAMP domain-containing protein [Thiolinea sp.]
MRFASHPERLQQQAAALMQPFCGASCAPEALDPEPQTRFVSVDGEERLRTFHPVRNQPRCMECHGPVSQHPVNGILLVDQDATPIRRKGLTNILMLGGAGSVVVLFSALAAWWFMQRYILRPTAVLDRASRHLSQGDFDTRVTVRGRDEMAGLAATFNHMAERLQQHDQLLHGRQQFLQGLIDTVPDGVRVIDSYYHIVQGNRSYAEQAGYASPQQLRQQYCYQVTYRRDTPVRRPTPARCATPGTARLP